MEKTIKIMLIALCAHLLYTNSELLIAAKECAKIPPSVFDKVALTCFALSYSLISALCVFRLRRYLPVMLFALLDGFAVYLRINVDQEPFLLLTSIFFGFYTFCLISFCFLISKQDRTEKAKTENQQNQTENHAGNLLLMESKTETTVKQLVCKLNPMKSEEKRLEIIRKQPLEIQKQLLEKYGYEKSEIETAQTQLEF